MIDRRRGSGDPWRVGVAAFGVLAVVAMAVAVEEVVAHNGTRRVAVGEW